MNFADRLRAAMQKAKNPVLVGIDPRPENLPLGFLDRFSPDRSGIAEALEQFGKGVVDVVAGKVPAVKFQSAFYEAYGPEGVEALFESARYARERGLIVIMDGKRNDIGSTAEAYARAYLGKVPISGSYVPTWDSDALTINPYLGTDGVDPFVKVAAREGKGVFVLVRTSNASAGEFQDLVCEGRPLYRHVAERLAGWASPHLGESGYSLVGAVVGATYPKELAELRAALPSVLFLIPGYGSQGAKAQDLAEAFDDQGFGAIVNNSRGLIFAYERADLREQFAQNWQGAIEFALNEMVEDLATHTRAGLLRNAS